MPSPRTCSRRRRPRHGRRGAGSSPGRSRTSGRSLSTPTPPGGAAAGTVSGPPPSCPSREPATGPTRWTTAPTSGSRSAPCRAGSGPSWCCFFEDLTEAETARLFGCTVGTVKSQTHKALARAAAGRGPRQRPHRPTSTRKGTGMNVDDLGTELRARSDETTGHHRSARLAEVRGRIAARRRARAGGAAVLVAVAVAAGRAGATADQRGAGDDRHRSGASGYGSGRPAGSRPAGVPPAIDGNPLAFSYLAPRGVDVFEQRVRLDVLDVTYQQLCRADDADGLRGAFTFANLSINGDSLYGSRAARATPPGRRCVQRAVAGDAARRRGSSRRSVHTPARGGPQGR